MEKLLCGRFQTWVAKSGHIIACSISEQTALCIKWEVQFHFEIGERCPLRFTNNHSHKLVVRPVA